VTTAPEIFGLVLVGGRSTRMGRDKAALEYGGKPQAVAAFELLSKCCSKVFLSCRQGQNADLPAIHDVVENIGPMGGIVSAFHDYPDKAWLVLACDLPFLTEATLRDLIARRDASQLATAFRSAHDGLPEPLCAIYEPAVAGKLREFVAQEKVCPRKALIKLGVPLLDLPDGRALDNVNHPHEFEEARAALDEDRR
jgi:molybdopterin-guanine dinucleotide biosynthesis protein A